MVLWLRHFKRLTGLFLVAGYRISIELRCVTPLYYSILWQQGLYVTRETKQPRWYFLRIINILQSELHHTL